MILVPSQIHFELSFNHLPIMDIPVLVIKVKEYSLFGIDKESSLYIAQNTTKETTLIVKLLMYDDRSSEMEPLKQSETYEFKKVTFVLRRVY